MKSNWHVATAAEATAAAQFARLGLDVSVQYGASQPEYDLIITDSRGRMLKVSVKGSKRQGFHLRLASELVVAKSRDVRPFAKCGAGPFWSSPLQSCSVLDSA
jgi:hypothetical protein